MKYALVHSAIINKVSPAIAPPVNTHRLVREQMVIIDHEASDYVVVKEMKHGTPHITFSRDLTEPTPEQVLIYKTMYENFDNTNQTTYDIIAKLVSNGLIGNSYGKLTDILERMSNYLHDDDSLLSTRTMIGDFNGNQVQLRMVTYKHDVEIITPQELSDTEVLNESN